MAATADFAGTGRKSGHRCCVSAAAWHIWRGWHGSGPVRTGGDSLCGSRGAGFRAGHGQGADEKVCQNSGLPVVEHVVLLRDCLEAANYVPPFPFPVFVKPANLGSSVGITKVKSQAELGAALSLAARYDRKILVERGIRGREFECAVLDGHPPQASMPCEIIPSQEFYTYEDKYILDQARIELPAKLDEVQTEQIRRLAVAAFEATACEGMARVDFLMEAETGDLFINEINTIPGFTSISMFPKMWAYSGLPYSRLLDRLIELAFERDAARRQTQYSK